jgi:diguanylate cyclase (GGDEF)-like protein
MRDDRFARDPYFAGFERCSLLVVPIFSQGVLRAILLLENRLSRGAFTTDRLDAVKLVAGQLAVSLDNALLYASIERKVDQRSEALTETNRRLEILSATDPLTGLPNRRRFTEVLRAEWERAKGSRGSIAIAMIDIDNFKPYNDRYGHLAGDACLRRVANALNESVRKDFDLVARYGGEEFAVILRDADEATATPLAEHARTGVAALVETQEGSATGIVTVSIGVAAGSAATTGAAYDLVGQADEALYAAKRRGGNRVVVAARHLPIARTEDR